MDFWPTKLTESKGDMYSTIYQELICMGTMAIHRELDMFLPNMKKSPVGECLAENDRRTRWTSSQQT